MRGIKKIPGYVNPNRQYKYNRRQRKKYRIGEFQELGCELSIRFDSEVQMPQIEQFIADLNDSELGPRALCFAGGRVDPPDCIVCVMATGSYESVSEDACRRLLDWVGNYPGVIEATGRQLDVYYDIDAML